MITVETLKRGINEYLSSEFLAKMPEMKRMVMGIGVAQYIEKLDAVLEQNKPLLQRLGYLTAEGDVNIDQVYQDLRDVATKKGDLRLTAPVLGDIRFGPTELEKLYETIIAQSE